MFNSKGSKNILKFVSPSNNSWKDGLLTGNGEIGLNVYGGAGREVVLVNSNKLSWKGNTGVLPDISDKVKNIIKSLKESKYREAENTLTDALIAKNYKPECAYPLPLCDLIFKQDILSNTSDYFRQLNMESGEIQTEFKTKNVKFDRNIFVSHLNNVICYNIVANGSKNLNGSFTIDLHKNNFYENVEIDLPYETKTDKDYLIFSARNEDGTDFGCVAKIFCTGGILGKNANTFIFKGADRIFILAKTFVLERKEDAVAEIKEELANLKMPYEKLLKESSAVHSKFLRQVDINLNVKNYEEIDKEILENKVNNYVSNSLIERMYLYGKHLFISGVSSTMTACGPFNGAYNAKESCICNFGGLQKMLNFALKNGLTEQAKNIFEKFYDNLDDYKKNSTRLFGCKGIYVPSIESPESGLPGSVESKIIMNYNVASYISSMMYKYYIKTNDKEFMEKIGFEFIEETGLFYEELLKLNKETNVFEMPFGYSPFSTPTNIGISDNCYIASNYAGDFACAKYIFSILNELCLLFNKDEKDVARWEKLVERIPDHEVDKNGYLKEYNGKMFETNNFSPFIYFMFPYNIGFRPFETRRDFDDLIANTIKYRFVNSFGKFDASNLCDMATALSTCGDSYSSYEVMSILLKNFLNNNLLISNYDNVGNGIGTYNNIECFNIDNNMGICNCLQNMFVNSSKNNLYLFKCLPQNFQKGSVKNLLLDNQIKFDMEFNNKRGIAKIVLKAPANYSVKIYLPNGFRKVKGVEQNQIDSQFMCLNNVSLPANKSVCLKIYYKA